MDRPGLRGLLAYVATHEVGCCIVANLDRFTRRMQDAADIDQALADAGVAVVVATDHTGHIGSPEFR